jgi:hypothetical protein
MLVALCSFLALGTAVFIGSIQQPEPVRSIPKAEAFRWAVNRAMSAAELTQTARSVKEWQQVSDWWQEAIQLMQTVPISDRRYGVAVARVPEYQANLRYAEKRAQEARDQPATAELWGIGSRAKRRCNMAKVRLS